MTHLLLFSVLTSMAFNCHSKNCSLPECGDSVKITLIVCITLMVICWKICNSVKKYKLEVIQNKHNNEMEKIGKEKESVTQKFEIEKEKEKLGYREKLLNFLENRAKKPEETCEGDDKKSTKRIFDDEYSKKYIDKLEEFIKNVVEQE